MKRALAWIGRAIINHGLTKFSALVIALVFFVVTRDDVTRTFTIPLHVVQDPNRVLLTKLPETLTVELHGSWARMSRLREQELGRAELDLSDARPGPLAIDPAQPSFPLTMVGEVLFDFEAKPGETVHFETVNYAGRGFLHIVLIIGVAPLFLAVERVRD